MTIIHNKTIITVLTLLLTTSMLFGCAHTSNKEQAAQVPQQEGVVEEQDVTSETEKEKEQPHIDTSEIDFSETTLQKARMSAIAGAGRIVGFHIPKGLKLLAYEDYEPYMKYANDPSGRNAGFYPIITLSKFTPQEILAYMKNIKYGYSHDYINLDPAQYTERFPEIEHSILIPSSWPTGGDFSHANSNEEFRSHFNEHGCYKDRVIKPANGCKLVIKDDYRQSYAVEYGEREKGVISIWSVHVTGAVATISFTTDTPQEYDILKKIIDLGVEIDITE